MFNPDVINLLKQVWNARLVFTEIAAQKQENIDTRLLHVENVLQQCDEL